MTSYPVTIQARYNRNLTPEQAKMEIENLDYALRRAQDKRLPPVLNGRKIEDLPDAALQGGRVDSIDRMPEWAIKVLLKNGFKLSPVQMTYAKPCVNTDMAKKIRRKIIDTLNAQWNPRWYDWIRPVVLHLWFKVTCRGAVDFDLYRTDWIEDTPGMVERAMQSKHISLEIFDHSELDEDTEKMAGRINPFGKRTLRTVEGNNSDLVG